MCKRAFAALLAGTAFITCATGVLAQSMPSQQLREVMIKTTLGSFNDANLTNNYEVFHALLSQALADTYSPTEFSDAFVSFRDQEIDIGVVVAFPPVEDPAPFIDADAVLHLKGYFETSPSYVAYDMGFIGEEDGVWRLSGIDVQVATPETLGLAPAEDAEAEPSAADETPDTSKH